MPSLKWIGKKDIKNHHNEVKYHIIECKENIGEKDTGNMVIKGDNLIALKALLPYYGGKVKMIYIDPPYNTGNTSWVYNDAVDSPIIKKWLSKVVDKEDLSRSDKWLCMIYPRLKILHQFLREDGVIYISIDDAEIHNLRLLMNEIFGKNNFIGTLIWRKKEGGGQTDHYFVTEHEYVLVFAKNKEKFQWINDFKQKDISKFNKEDERGKYYRTKLEKWGSGARKEDRPTMAFPIIDPDGNEFYPVAPDGSEGRFRVGKKRMEDIISQGLLEWEYKNNRWIPYEKTYYDPDLIEIIKERSILYDLATTGMGTNALTEIFGVKDIFENPKPIELIEFLIKHSTNETDLILDSFAGTGTTGHAVLRYNKIHKTNHKFILIEIEQEIAEKITRVRLERVVTGYNYKGKQKSQLIKPIKITPSKLLNIEFMNKLNEEINSLIESVKDNYDKIEKKFKNNTLEIIGVKEVDSYMEGLGGGFQYCELSEELFDEFGLLNENITFKMLAKHIYFTEFGIALSEKSINEESCFAGSFQKTALYIFIDKKFTRRDLKKLSNEFEEFIVYADSTTLSNEQLKEHNILLKKIPFEIKDK